MSTHLYAFGSVCRGEIDRGSDVDLLACVDGPAPHIDPEKYSIYRHDRVRALWNEGNPFAWHLHLESKLLFSSDGEDFLTELGRPGRYRHFGSDARKFRTLFDQSYAALNESVRCTTFHLSCIFLAIRNSATCYSLAQERPVFSRNSPFLVEPALIMDEAAFAILTRARLLSTRGFGENLSAEEVARTQKAVETVPSWMDLLWSQAAS